MEKKSQLLWYKRKKFYLPVAVVLGVIGVLPSLVSFRVSIDDEFNPDYYSDPNEPMFKKNGSIIYGTDESELILQPHFHFRY